MNTTVAVAPIHKNWKELYKAALFEMDSNMLSERIAHAEWALAIRARELFHPDEEHLEERLAMDAAISALQTLHSTITGSSKLRFSTEEEWRVGMSSMYHENWETSYRLVALEVNGRKMPGRISAAREAITGRLRAIEGDSDHHEEGDRLEHAVNALRVLTTETKAWK